MYHVNVFGREGVLLSHTRPVFRCVCEEVDVGLRPLSKGDERVCAEESLSLQSVCVRESWRALKINAELF